MQLWRYQGLSEMVQKYFSILFLSIGLLSSIAGYAKDPDYKVVFGKQWVNAELFLSDNSDWMKEICNFCKVDYEIAVSVVFPELIRYSALRDKIEITLLKSLYVHKGKEYSNFSVGKFQIKPSCAEAVINEWKKPGSNELNKYFNRKYRFLLKKAKRIQILDDLEETRNEFLFVVAIVSSLDNKYRQIKWISTSEKVKFYASAYNCGFNNSFDWIEKHIDLKLFHTKTIKPVECYSYAYVAEDFYNSKR